MYVRSGCVYVSRCACRISHPSVVFSFLSSRSVHEVVRYCVINISYELSVGGLKLPMEEQNFCIMLTIGESVPSASVRAEC